MTELRTLDRVDVKGKRILLRVDLNVPVENGVVTDATRIERIAPSITELADKGAKVILLSHFGLPKGRRDPKYSLRPVCAEVSRVIKRPVTFVEDCIGDVAESAIAKMRPGDIACLENVRFYPEEEDNDPKFAEKLASLGDIYVDDAFSVAHRAHASNTAIGTSTVTYSGATSGGLPAYAGRTMQAEIEALTRAFEDPERPLTAIVGGAKISTKLDLLGNLLDKVDILIIGGAMANTFLLAQGKDVGKSLVEADLTGTARDILAKAKAAKREIVLPVDAVVAQKFEARAPSRVVDIDKVSGADMILDIGPRSVEQVVSVLARSKTLVWNGPFGAFEMEPFDNGTVEVAEAAAELSDAGKLVSVAGGGDTVAALNVAGVADRLTYVSTAGGAFLEFLEGKDLPGVEVVRVK